MSIDAVNVTIVDEMSIRPANRPESPETLPPPRARPDAADEDEIAPSVPATAAT